MAMTDREGDTSLSLASSCSKLPHSHSTPVGVDGGVGTGTGSRTPPATPKKGGKMLAIRVQMLDDTVTMFQVQAKAIGRVLFDQVCKQLHLLEADYFGLEYQDANDTRYWLDLEKPLARQVGLTLVDPLLRFCVKFYTPDPAQLEEEFTRYLFCLQIKRDLAQGHTQCNDNTAALMASYIVQAECGDYVAEDYPDPSYLSSYKFVPHQDRELERRIMENHKKHAGQSPAEADLNLLETARRCELYGMKMHPAKDNEGVPLNLSVAHMGIVVFQNYTKINTFSWAKIRKISFKRKRFLIKLHPEGYGYYKDTVEFFFEGRNECKNFWKKCVENHGFFRCSSVKRVPRQRTRVLSRGSSFRYSGKTQKQIVEFVRENYVKRQTFQRSQSFRHSSSVHSSVATNVGGSISAHPLLPLGDSSIVSLSCGSMSLAGVGAGSPSPTVRRLAQTNPATTIVTSMIHSDTPSHHTSYTQGQIYDTNIPISPQSSITESYCRHCGEGFDSIPSSRRSSTRIKDSPYKETRSSQTDIVDIEDYEEPIVTDKRYTWQRSASCKELVSSKSRTIELKSGERSLDQPVTRYDDSQRSCYSIAGSKTPSLDHSTVDVPETKVYSSSYPGTTSSLSTESGGGDEGGLEPGGSILVIDTGSSREEIILSHDDLSHDSYELLEREGACLYGESRSISLESSGEQLFTMDDDFENDVDVEKRLGYVEPRYSDIGFNEFNEKCKQDFAIKRNVEFSEFNAKCRPGMVIGFDDEIRSSEVSHFPVERTKSDPYVSEFWKVAKQHRKLLHQKSVDLTPTESGLDATSNVDADMKQNTLGPLESSKSTVDIPYTLHKHQHMNGTAPEKAFESRSPHLSPAKVRSPMKSPDVVRKDKIKQPKKMEPDDTDHLSRIKNKPDLNSQDSGLSLSLGTESVDDIQDALENKLDVNTVYSTKKEEVKKEDVKKEEDKKEENITVCKASKTIVVRDNKEDKETLTDSLKTDLLQVPEDMNFQERHGRKEMVKGKSEEMTRSKKGTLSKSRQVHSAEGIRKEGSFEKRDSGVKVIKIDSEGSVCHCDRKDAKYKDIKSSSLESSDPDVIIVEYRGNRKRAFQKRSSSGSKDSVDKDYKRSGSLESSKSFDKDKSSKDTKSEKKPRTTKFSKSRSSSREEKDKVKTEDKEKETDKEGSKESKKVERQDVSKEKVVEHGKDDSKTIEVNNIKEAFKEKDIPKEEMKIDILSREPVNLEIKKDKVSERIDETMVQKDTVTNIDKEKSKTDIKSDKEIELEQNDRTDVQRKINELPLAQKKDETDKTESGVKKSVTSPETSWKKFGDLPAPLSHKRERSPILFARLGLSEGSAFSPTHRQTSVQSPSSSRRAKSLDAPVVSLHRLPPVTSFSSKDDTLDVEQQIELEEKSIKLSKGSTKTVADSIVRESIKEEKEDVKEEDHHSVKDNIEQKDACTDKEDVNIGIEPREKLSPHSEYTLKDSLELKNEIVCNRTEKIGSPLHRSETKSDNYLKVADAVDIPDNDNIKSKGGQIEKEKEDITVTLEKLDEVVDRVKSNGMINKQDTEKINIIDSIPKESEYITLKLSPEISKREISKTGDDSVFIKKGSTLSPLKQPVFPIQDDSVFSRSPCSPLKPPLSPEKEDSSLHLPPSPASLSPLRKDAPSSPKDPPLSPTIIEPPLSPSAERRPSTRQERIDSFKKTYSVDLWTSDEADLPDIPVLGGTEIDYTSKDYDDETFITEMDTKEVKHGNNEDNTKVITSKSELFEEQNDSNKNAGNEIISTEDECWVSVEDIRDIGDDSGPQLKSKESGDLLNDTEDVIKVDDSSDISKVIMEKDPNKLEQTIKEFMEVIEPLDEPSTSGVRIIPEKRSFDEEPSSSSSIKQVELSSTWKPFPLESSGSSSLEEGIFPPDDTGHYADEEEGSSHSNDGHDDFPTGFGYPVTGAEMIISGYTGGIFGLSRTLSRISERSTTSEQERSDFEDDVSTKPSSRSLSVDDESLLSSDRQPSLSSDPPSGTNLEDQPLPELPPLPESPKEPSQEKLDFKIPPPLLPQQGDDWPSPPNSSPFDTPVISHVETFYMEIKPEEATKVVVVESKDIQDGEDCESSTDENKTLQEECPGGFDDSALQDGTVKLAMRPKTSTGMYGNSASEDTSIAISDWSSSTSTVKHCQYYSCAVKSDDSSLAGDFGLSLSNEMLSVRKGSDDSIDRLQVKRTGLYKATQRSFDDYDSPYSESDEGQSKPVQQQTKRSSHHLYYSNVSSPTSTLGVKKCSDRSKFSRSGLKCTPYYSAPIPVSHEHRDVSEIVERRSSSSKSIARSKCYSYYSLARSPPSDGSSSSLENPEPPSAPNTIPRVSKRRRHVAPTKRRHRVSVDMEVRDGHIVSVSSPSVVACGRNRQTVLSSQQHDIVIDPARQASSSKQSSV